MNKLNFIEAILLTFVCWSVLNTSRTQAQTNFQCSYVASPTAGNSTANASCLNASADYTTKYGRYAYHIPDANTPVKTIKVNINVWQPNNGTGSWQNNANDLVRLNQIINWANNTYQYITTPSDIVSGVSFILDSKIRIELQNVFFYQNSAMCYLGSAGGSDGITLNTAVAAIDPKRLEALNIHITLGSYFGASDFAVFPNSTNNLNMDSYIVAFNNGSNPVSDYAFAGTIAHELGHCLDLEHTYGGANCNTTSLDYLSDIFNNGPCPHDGGWFVDPFLATNTGTNNTMGGCKSGGYLSPMQMGKMHRALALKSVRRYVKNCAYSTVAKSITTNETWDFDIKFYSDIIVEAGATLTVKCKVLMPDEARIIVKQGGKLIIDGGTITNGCGLMWQGIEVWGDATQIQNTTTQGYLVMSNGATIENARNGVSLSKAGAGYAFNGGVIQATDATFKNNKRCIEFLGYHKPSGIDGNNSFFNNCTFISTAALNDPVYVDTYGRRTGTQTFVTLQDVVGVFFRGCTFQTTGAFDIDLRGCGIYSEDASYTIVALGTGSSMDKTEFKDLTYGVYAKTFLTTASRYLTIKNTLFTNNQQGIQGNLNFGSIDNNTFTIPGFVGNPSSLKQWGIYLDGAKGFNINHNEFTGLSLNQSYGVVVKGSESFGGTIAFNTFTGLNFANQTELNNQLLKISCNTYTNNTKSWSLNPTSVNGLFPSQGTGTANGDLRAGNVFNDACTPVGSGRHIHSYLNNNFNYYVIGTVQTNPSNKYSPACKIGNIMNNFSSVNPDQSCYEAPPCTTQACAGAQRIKMQAETNSVTKHQLASAIIRTNNEQGNFAQNSTLLAELNTEDASKVLIAESIANAKFDAAKVLLNALDLSTDENKMFYNYYSIAINLYAQGKTFYNSTPAQQKMLSAIAQANTTVATNAQLVLESINQQTINRNPEVNPLTEAEVTGVDEFANNEGISHLYANQPNPFTSTTTIKVWVATTAVNATLQVTTALGKVVKTTKLAKGDNTIEITSNNLVAGLYFYYLIDNNKLIDAKRMIVQE